MKTCTPPKKQGDQQMTLNRDVVKKEVLGVLKRLVEIEVIIDDGRISIKGKLDETRDDK